MPNVLNLESDALQLHHTFCTHRNDPNISRLRPEGARFSAVNVRCLYIMAKHLQLLRWCGWFFMLTKVTMVRACGWLGSPRIDLSVKQSFANMAPQWFPAGVQGVNIFVKFKWHEPHLERAIPSRLSECFRISNDSRGGLCFAYTLYQHLGCKTKSKF